MEATKLLTVSEVAEMLRKSPDQIRWMIHRGTAPRSALIGSRRLFKEVDVLAYIEAAFDSPGRA